MRRQQSFLSSALLNHCRGHEEVHKYSQMQHCGRYSQKAKAYPSHNECFPTTTTGLKLDTAMQRFRYFFQTKLDSNVITVKGIP